MSGNKTLLEELLFNLCSNAVRYNKKGGSVTIVTTIENTRPVLIVKDTGIGIPKEQQERVFERFYRVDKSRSKSIAGRGKKNLASLIFLPERRQNAIIFI
jgi:two-component system phosphate regulon sensor histidine kinase PhoR